MSTKKFFYFSIFIILILSCVFPFAMASEFDYVYLGGVPVGIVMEDPGLSICGKCEVITQNGATIPSLNVEIMPGDYLVMVNDQKVDSLDDIARILDGVKEGEEITLGIKRGDETINCKITPSLDALTKKLKLGLIIQDDLNGIGTLTYCTKDGKFGALGHSISSSGDKTQSGKLYGCKIIGVKRPRVGEAGELQGYFDKSTSPRGKIENNNAIYSEVKNNSKQQADKYLELIKESNEELMERYEVVTERVAEIAADAKETGTYADYFERTAQYLMLLNKIVKLNKTVQKLN